MIHVALLLFLLAAPVDKPAPTATESPFKKVDITALFKGPKVKVVPIRDGKAAVNGSQIKVVEVGKQKVAITYFNKTKERIQPRYKFRVFDAYGIQLGTFSDTWTFLDIQPGQLHTEKPLYDSVDGLEEALKYSGVVLPANWDVPAYLVIEADPVQVEKLF